MNTDMLSKAIIFKLIIHHTEKTQGIYFSYKRTLCEATAELEPRLSLRCLSNVLLQIFCFLGKGHDSDLN